MSEQQLPNNGLPMFYSNPAVLDSEKHRNFSLKTDMGFGFAGNVNAVPVNLIEFPQVAHFYPIAFSNDGTATPVAILGARDNENLYTDADGNWENAIYIPAYIRRYPFIFTEMDKGENLGLCIDQNDSFIVEDTSNPFFDKDGKPTELSENAMEFCRSYHTAAQHSAEFSKAIAEADILVDRQAEFTIGKDERVQFSGFQVVDEKKLNALDAKIIADWHTKGWLGGLYAHLFSSFHWAKLSTRLREREQAKAA